MTSATFAPQKAAAQTTMPLVPALILGAASLVVCLQICLSGTLLDNATHWDFTGGFFDRMVGHLWLWTPVILHAVAIAWIGVLNVLAMVALKRHENVPFSLARVLRWLVYLAVVTALTTWHWAPDGIEHVRLLWAVRAAITAGLPLTLLVYLSRSRQASERFGQSAVAQVIDAAAAMVAGDGARVILMMLAALLLVLGIAAVPSIVRFGGSFLVTNDWRTTPLPVLKTDANGNPIRDHRTRMFVVDHYVPPRYGAVASVSGTAVTSLLALIFAVPLSFGAAVFLVRIATRRLIAPVSFLVEFLAAIPSIAYGLWGMFVLGPWLAGESRWLHPLQFLEKLPGAGQWQPMRWLAHLPLVPAGIEDRVYSVVRYVPVVHGLFEQSPGEPYAFTGRDIFCGGIILGIMIVPIITAISRDVLNNVPRAQIEGTYALGSTWWQSVREMFQFSRSALFGAVILGLARAAGETMAVLMVMGNTPIVAKSPLLASTTMAAALASEFGEAASDDLHRGALMEIALILLILSLLFNVVARSLVVGRSARTAAAF